MKLEIVQIWCSEHEDAGGLGYSAGYFTNRIAAEMHSAKGTWGGAIRVKLVNALKIEKDGNVGYQLLGHDITVHESEEARLTDATLKKLNDVEIAALKNYWRVDK